MKVALSIARSVVLGAGMFSLAAAPTGHLLAQVNDAVRGGLAGVVTDPSGAAVPGAKVTVAGPQQTLNLTTNATGHWEATGLTPGLYTVTVTAPGFTKYVSSNNEVTVDHSSTLDAKLTVGDPGTTVQVEAGVISIDTENTSVNSAITDQFYEQLPLPRNVSGAFYTAPGVVTGGGTGTANPSISGSSGLENLYIADGVTITDQAYGGLGVYTPSHGSLGTGINLAFVKEVDIKTEAFEPKYGQGDGGIVEIITKSGSNSYHGGVTAYVTPEFGFASAIQPYMFPFTILTPSALLSTPQYELATEVGGFIKKDKLFFFGAFDPTLNRQRVAASPNSGLRGNVYNYNTTSANWAAKLTFTPTGSTIVEASSYGDPSRNNSAPSTTSALSAASVSSSYNFGTRNSVLRANTLLAPWLTAFGAFSYNHAHFSEFPSLAAAPGYSDRRSTPYQTYGLGTYYKTLDNSWQLQGEMQATAHFFGKHTPMIGYLFDHVDFENSTLRSGPGYVIPGSNVAGVSFSTLYPGYIPSGAVGRQSNAQYRLYTTTGCTYCTVDKNGNQIYFQVYRGTYNGSQVSSVGRYKTAYGNEVYSPNKYLTLNAGLRWEEQTYGGSFLTYYWRDNWSPRLGVTVDPFGDRKSKVFFAFSRYQAPLPLDAAIRQLGSEQDDTSFYFPAVAVNGVATTDATGAYTPDTTKALNGTPKTATASFGRPSFSSSTGEGIIPGTKMEYTDEYTLGLQREVSHGMLVAARYTDRHFGRIVEDIGSQSPEGSNVDGAYAGGIANVNAATDIAVNENEVVYSPSQFSAANPGKTPGNVTAATYVAPAPGCTFTNDTAVANGGYFIKPDGSNYNGSCITNAAVAGTYGADGKPDGFADPRRHYQALELELNRALRNHWQARINYRFAKLWGNYEGFFRNDNGQSDPGISSLFDFTQGALGLLGDQFKRGYLNTDRRHVFNGLFAYTFDKSQPHLGLLNGLTAGTYLHVTSGNPISRLLSHPIYGNQGEVPVGGRGTYGRLPVAAALDLHLEDSYRFHDKYVVRAAFDGFNVTDSQPMTSIDQYYDTAPLSAGGVINPDYNLPTSWQPAFHARFKLGFEF